MITRILDLLQRALTSDHFLALLLSASGIGYFALRAVNPSWLGMLVKLVRTRRFGVAVCALFVAAYMVALGYSTAYPGYLEHSEPLVASVSSLLARGAPVYHGLESAQRYAAVYGPMEYVPYAVALRVFGASVFTLKLVVLLANATMFVVLWRAYTRVGSRVSALIVTVGVLSVLLANDYMFQVRGDCLILLAVATSVLAVRSASTRTATILLAVACGLAVDIKLTALLYFLPLFALFVDRFGWRRAIATALAAAGIAAIPFASPQISLPGYIDWLRVVARQPHTSGMYLSEPKVLAIAFAPVLLLLWSLGQKNTGLVRAYLRDNALFLVTLAGCVALIAVVAGKIGAGTHHFMPFYPIIGLVCATIYGMIAQ